MLTIDTMPTSEPADSDLVFQSRAGNRDAFERIVRRYQTLLCSLAYAGTGSMAQSEDIAQETFLIAWKGLHDLREPEKLRSWLCGIVRNRVYKTARGQSREPSHAAEAVDALDDLASSEPLPADRLINAEEEAFLWRALEQLPETYREPLVLFYREHQSIETVAHHLELTEDAVKQRLSRGRKLLQDRVLSFLEGTLARTSPGKLFTAGVMAALPMAVTTAKAATISAVIAKGGTAAKSTAMAGALAGFLPMIGGAYIGMRARANDTKSSRERAFMSRIIGVRIVSFMVLLVAFALIRKSGVMDEPFDRSIGTSVFLFVSAVLGISLYAYTSERQRRIQIEDGTFSEAEWTLPRWQTDRTANPNDGTAKNLIKAARFLAFGLMMALGLVAQGPWKQHPAQAVLLTVGMAAMLVWAYRSWQQHPRYISMRSRSLMGFLATYGGLTLVGFNWHQYRLQKTPGAVGVASMGTIVIFNLAVIVAYGLLIGVLAWNYARSRSARSK